MLLSSTQVHQLQQNGSCLSYARYYAVARHFGAEPVLRATASSICQLTNLELFSCIMCSQEQRVHVQHSGMQATNSASNGVNKIRVASDDLIIVGSWSSLHSSAFQEVESCESNVSDSPANCYPHQQYYHNPAQHSSTAWQNISLSQLAHVVLAHVMLLLLVCSHNRTLAWADQTDYVGMQGVNPAVSRYKLTSLLQLAQACINHLMRLSRIQTGMKVCLRSWCKSDAQSWGSKRQVPTSSLAATRNTQREKITTEGGKDHNVGLSSLLVTK